MTYQVLLLVLANLTSFGSVARPQVVDAAEFKKSILDEWESVSSSTRTMKMTQEVEWHSAFGEKPLRFDRRDVIKVAYSPKGSKSVYTSEEFDESLKPQRRINQLVLVNADYKAILEKSAGKDAWIMIDLIQPAPPDEANWPGRICPWLRCGNIFLPDWIADDRFVITRIEQREDPAPADVVRVHFRHDPPRKKPGAPELDHGVDSGWIDFDRSRHYCVLGYRFERRDRVSESLEIGTFEYDGQAGGIPVLKKVTEEMPEFRHAQAGKGRSRTEWTFDIEYDASVPEEEFRLSHYGLPEPMGVTWRPPTPMYVWFLLGAAIAAVLAVRFRFLARRTKKPA